MTEHETVTVSINSRFSFRLTPLGKELYLRSHRDMNLSDNGIVEMSFGDIIKTFGEHMTPDPRGAWWEGPFEIRG